MVSGDRALDDQHQAVRQCFRVGDAEVPRQVHGEASQCRFAVLDDGTPGMAGLGQFDRDVGHWTTAKIGAADLVGIVTDHRA